MEDFRKSIPGLIVLAATGILGAGVLTGAVSVSAFITFIGGAIGGWFVKSPLGQEDDPPHDTP